tara:strand:+ start:170 stop:592 length:423 start_codon:yes stop_codon:yes gene_type:complete
MNILFLQGPNLNLLGVKSVATKSKLTLDRLNKAVKNESKELNINLKTLQTHKEFQAINFLQRNRNWANGLIFIPTSWARNNYTILETILLIEIKTAVIYFDNNFSFGTSQEKSILTGLRLKSFKGSPISICKEALGYVIK